MLKNRIKEEIQEKTRTSNIKKKKIGRKLESRMKKYDTSKNKMAHLQGFEICVTLKFIAVCGIL